MRIIKQLVHSHFLVTNQGRLFVYLVRWIFLAFIVGILSGSASALFLVCLDKVTYMREYHHEFIFFLAIAGFIMGLIYHYYGKDVERGINLILDEIHNSDKVIRLRMAPLVLGATLVTHLFGGSAGREGTAIQMGGSIADQISRLFSLASHNRRLILMAGMSGGFASVFGTPLAGIVFGLEVLAIGKLHYDAIFPCLIAALIGNATTHAWGVHHIEYSSFMVPELTAMGFISAIIAGISFGLIGKFFALFTHKISHLCKSKIAYAPLRPFFGGIIVTILLLIFGVRYAGLGIPVMLDAFKMHVLPFDFILKFLLTSVTLGFGFKGGEVTPLFFIGATLGNTLSYFLPLPTALLSSMGFVAVFAGAANTPIASIFLAIELFGSKVGVYAAIACIVSYLFSGYNGIYGSQKFIHNKIIDK